jgi:isopentenyl-diphosphate delta-isomerase
MSTHNPDSLTPNIDQTVDRKDSHLSICLEEDIDYSAQGSNGFASYRFDHDALPEIDYAKINLAIELFGKKLSAPLIVGAMTGGTSRAGEINRRLALAAEICQVGFALGSQRKLLKNSGSKSEDAEILKSYDVRNHAPKIPLLFGNVGAVQLNYGVTARQLRTLIDSTGCDAFNFHLNPLQEAIQPEGDRNFSSLIPKLKDAIPELGVPVLLKEVGAGISATTARKIKSIPFQGIETAGMGGTSWSKIEALRSSDPAGAATGRLFAQWGIPTAESLLHCRSEFPERVVICSGGIRNGIEAAKAIALGADAVALALPFLKAAEKSVDDAVLAIQQVITELRTVLFITGMGSVAELRKNGSGLLKKAFDPTSRGTQ